MILSSFTFFLNCFLTFSMLNCNNDFFTTLYYNVLITSYDIVYYDFFNDFLCKALFLQNNMAFKYSSFLWQTLTVELILL